mgnify:CR=1 FL=1
MYSLRNIYHHHDKLRQVVTAGSLSAVAVACIYTKEGGAFPLQYNNNCTAAASSSSRRSNMMIGRVAVTECEDIRSKRDDQGGNTGPTPSRPSWTSRTLAFLRIRALPIPRRIVKGDPALKMNPKLIQKRQQDEENMQELIRGALQERDPKNLQALNDKCLELAYGEGVTLKTRQDFVHVSSFLHFTFCLFLSLSSQPREMDIQPPETRMHCMDRTSVGWDCRIGKRQGYRRNWSRKWAMV